MDRKPFAGLSEPPRYRWHLGCIPPRAPVISLRTGACNPFSFVSLFNPSHIYNSSSNCAVMKMAATQGIAGCNWMPSLDQLQICKRGTHSLSTARQHLEASHHLRYTLSQLFERCGSLTNHNLFSHTLSP